MVDLLALAHDRSCEAALAQCLTDDLEAKRLPNLTELSERFAPDPASLPEVRVQRANLSSYDDLLDTTVPVSA